MPQILASQTHEHLQPAILSSYALMCDCVPVCQIARVKTSRAHTALSQNPISLADFFP